MDPNANISEMLDIAARMLSAMRSEDDGEPLPRAHETFGGVPFDDVDRLCDLGEALEEWIGSGGFLQRDLPNSDRALIRSGFLRRDLPNSDRALIRSTLVPFSRAAKSADYDPRPSIGHLRRLALAVSLAAPFGELAKRMNLAAVLRAPKGRA